MQKAITPPGKSILQSEAASKSYGVVAHWEAGHRLTDAQQQFLDQVAEACSHRPLPPHLARAPSAAPEAPVTPSSSSARPSDADRPTPALEAPAVLNSRQEFYEWYSRMEAIRAQETEGKYRLYGESLSRHLSTVDTLLEDVQSTLRLFDLLLEENRTVTIKTRGLDESCERMVAEKDQLESLVRELQSRLNYFEESDRLANQLSAPPGSMDTPTLMGIFDRLDECIAFLSSHPHYADAGQYLGRFRQLQSRALGTIRTQAQAVLRHAVNQVRSLFAAANQQGNPQQHRQRLAPAVQEEEVDMLYVQFRAAAQNAGLKTLMQAMERRADRAEEYRRLVADCRSAYCMARGELVAATVEARVAALAGSNSPSDLARAGCVYLIGLCHEEQQLMEHFLPESASDPGALLPLMEALSESLYDRLRPKILTMEDLDQLCEVAEVLKGEILEDAVPRRGATVSAVVPIVGRYLADVRQRITFRAQAFIRDRVAGYSPQSAEDLDYPGKLVRAAAEGPGAPDAASDTGESAPAGFNTWYPSLQNALLCLTKIFRVIDTPIFGGLAQEAVAAATASLDEASGRIARAAGPLDGQLFLIKHLLVLREHLTSFEVEFLVTDVDLDFTHLRDQLKRLVAGDFSMFNLGRTSSLSQLINRGPRVLESQLDPRKDLDRQLRTACESYIMAVTKVVVEPMLSFITKVTALRATLMTTGGDPAAQRPLREQAFAGVDRLQETARKVHEAIQEALPRAAQLMHLYLTNPAVLAGPIKTNVLEAHGQFTAIVHNEYSEGEVAQVGLIEPQALERELDRLLGLQPAV